MSNVVSQSSNSRGSIATNSYQNIEKNLFYMKQKIERYYNLGVSLSQVLGIFDCANYVQYLLNLLEEYEVYLVL